MKRVIAILCVVLGVGYSGTLFARGAAAETSLMYFEMGGGEPVREPVNTATLPLLTVGAAFKVPSVCDLWDIKHKDQLVDRFSTMIEEHVEGTMDALGKQILINISAWAEGLLASAIQRAMPGMYDYSQNVHAQLTAEIEVAKESCESTLAKVRSGNSPLQSWKDASALEAWKDALGVSFTTEGDVTIGGQPNILHAEEAVAKDDGATSVPWFGGRKGGAGSDPINLIADTVKAGYALMAGSTETDTSVADTREVAYKNPLTGTAETRASRLGTLWESGEAAASWATRIVGERKVGFCGDCSSQHTGGAGMMAAYYDERKALETTWHALLSVEGMPSVAQMASVSSNSVHLTVHVVEALLAMETQDRRVYVERLVSDVAVSRTAEKAMALRRILRTAESTPEVAAYPNVQDELQSIQNDIRADLEELKWEIDIQKSLVSDTAASLIAYASTRRSQASQVTTRAGTEKTGSGTSLLLREGPIEREDAPAGETDADGDS